MKGTYKQTALELGVIIRTNIRNNAILLRFSVFGGSVPRMVK